MIHTLAHLAPTYPTVWANESWPEKLEVLFARAGDLGALGLSVGERHIGYRCTQAQEPKVRSCLGVSQHTAWVMNGACRAFDGRCEFPSF